MYPSPDENVAPSLMTSFFVYPSDKPELVSVLQYKDLNLKYSPGIDDEFPAFLEGHVCCFLLNL